MTKEMTTLESRERKGGREQEEEPGVVGGGQGMGALGDLPSFLS